MDARSLLVAALLASGFAWAAPPSSCPAARAAGREGSRSVGGRLFSFEGRGLAEVCRISSYCLGCHDGLVARDALPMSGSALGGTPDGGRGHPVDVPYPRLREGFRPAAALDPRVVLYDGNVACPTCHGGADASMKRLSVPNERSALCLCCHLK